VGDVVHTLPALHALRQHLPDAHIGWVAHPGPANLLEGHPEVDELILLPRRPGQYGGWSGFQKLVREIRSDSPGWDWAIDFQGLTKSGLVSLVSGARERVGFADKNSRELNPLFINHRVPTKSGQVIHKNLELLTPFNVPPDIPATAILPCTQEDTAYINRWLVTSGLMGQRFLVLDPFAGWESKLWPVNHWIQTAHMAKQKFGLRPLVFHGPEERGRAGQLVEKIDGAVLTPETTLRQYVALLRQCAAAMVAADTGPMHIAASQGVPVVALYGPSDRHRNSPVFSGARFETLQDDTQPCAGTFVRQCKHHEGGQCMATLMPEKVVEALERLLS
jgi:ADP-heptose:LPS heptosyltransferase